MRIKTNPARIDIWHNILWSKYKGEVFSSLYKINSQDEFDIRFIQVAETESNRTGLSGVDLAHHRYPHELIFEGSYDSVGFMKRVAALCVRTLRSDAVLSILTGYERPECWLQLVLIKLKGKKAAIFCDSTIYDKKQAFLKGLVKKIIFRSVDGIFGYGIRSREYVIHYGAFPRTTYHRCQAAALPLDYSVERALADRLAMAQDPAAPRYLYIGRISPEKGLDTLLHAFAKVKEQKASATLILVGDGPEREKLKALAGQLDLGDAVDFAGSKNGPALFQEYSKATCLVLPSTSEPWGLVVNEALSHGCPAIASEHCGCVPELVVEGKTGFTHVVGDVDDLTKKMLAAAVKFSNLEKTAWDCLGVMEHFTPDIAAEQILIGIRGILS